MTRTHACHIPSALGICAIILAAVATGCGESTCLPTSLGSATAPTPISVTDPVLQSALTLWQRGEQTNAIRQFVQADWSTRPLFTPGTTLSLTEEQFQSQLQALPAASRVNAKAIGIASQLDSIKQLAAAVSQAGQAAAAAGDLALARRHFEALQRCGAALHSSDSLAILRFFGQGIKERADAELAGLPQ